MRDNNLMTTAAGNRGWCWGFILAFARVSCLGTGGFWAFTACFYVFLIFQAIIPPAKVAPARGCCPSLGTMHGAVSRSYARGDQEPGTVSRGVCVGIWWWFSTVPDFHYLFPDFRCPDFLGGVVFSGPCVLFSRSSVMSVAVAVADS